MKNESCPKCGESGKLVKEITLHSLLKDSEKDRLGNSPYFFCQTPTCEVVYFDETKVSVFKKDALTVRVGIKESEAPRPVCYCFDHTIEEIEEQVAATGESTVLDDIATRMKKGCWCETKSPAGSCCMSTVSRYIKAVKIRAGEPVTESGEEEVEDCCAASSDSSSDSRRKLGIWATVGAITTAVLSSACCWLPLLLIAFGASAAGVSGFFEAYRFWFLGATGAFLALGFYLVYFRREKCSPESSCAPPNSKILRFNKVMLWVATVVVALFSFFPNYRATFLSDANADVAIPENHVQVSLNIEGMTCQGCANGVAAALAKLDGVSSANIDFSKKSGTINFLPEKIDETTIVKTIEKSGYTVPVEKKGK